MRSRVREPLGKLLSITLALNCLAGVAPVRVPAQATQGGQHGQSPAPTPTPGPQKNRVIVVNADQPNVWTLEQAHYLLSQMHRRNLDLRAKRLEDLDANEIAGLRFDVLRTLVEFGATFNQADLATNRLLSRDQNFNAERRQSLLLRRDQLREESLTLTRRIAELEDEKADAESEEEKARLDADIAAKTALRSKVDKEIEFQDNELKTLSAPSGQLKATEAQVQFDPNKLPKSVFDKAFEEAAKSQIEKFNEEPRLNATLRLDNFLQMQYEIIAKQLTLLRDEVGPGERLLFLELPQTINVAHHEANKKWAQSWWKIAGYTRHKLRPAASPTPGPAGVDTSPTPKLLENQRPVTTRQEIDSVLRGETIYLEVQPTPTPAATPSTKAPTTADPKPQYVGYVNEFVNLDKNPDGPQELQNYLSDRGAVLSNRIVRTVDLIPRQSSLNVNDMKLRVKSGAFSFVASFLFGFGSRLNVQRQREQFSQFVQQELYSAAFGKGSREFGWTFTPMPGTDRLHSGVRTTYAVVVVPEEATSIVLEANGCYFPRSHYQPNNFDDTRDSRWGEDRTSRGCGVRSKVFLVPVPGGGAEGTSDFWVKGIFYRPVGKGKRIVVLISGQNFSTQIGVLVNGVPLLHSIGLAQPLIRDDSRAGDAASEEFADAEVRGRIERIDSNKIVFSFEMPKDFEGTPNITLVAPGKAIDINWLENVDINGRRPSVLDRPANACAKGAAQGAACKRICEDAFKTDCLTVGASMFQGDPAKPFRIDGVEVFRLKDRKVSVLITGAGFNKEGQRVFVNGADHSTSPVSSSLYSIKSVDEPLDEKIHVTITRTDDGKTIKSTAVVNPTRLSVDKVKVIGFEPAKGKQPAVLLVRIEGSGFTELLEPPAADKNRIKVTVTSSSEAFLRITDPDATEAVTLTDGKTKIPVSFVVARRPPKE